jgi:Fe2+ or Zn2+ uptake regulation protein
MITITKNEDLFKKYNLRNTQQRKIIYKDVILSKSHPTAEDVYRSVKKKIPNISLGTVYRNLETLEKKGLIKKIDIDKSKKRYDGDLNDHFHIICLKCGKVEDIKFEKKCNFEDYINIDTEYKIIGRQIEIYGICPECLVAVN